MRRFLWLLALTVPLCAQVRITRHGNEKISVDINGKPFTEFFIGSDTPKPYLHPLRAATGTIVTRGYPMDPNVPGESHDHPHHKGLWFTHGEVNGYDYWGNEPSQKGGFKGKGNVVLEKVIKTSGGRKSGVIEASFVWEAHGEKMLRETRRMVFYDEPDMRVIDFDIDLKALEKVVFGDTKEGTFAIRLAPELEEEQPRRIPLPKRTGHMINAQGQRGEANVWGKRSEWVDYYGKVHGEAVGIAIFDHPGNPRHPTWWHARGYGLFAANPFGEHDFERDKTKDGSLTLEPGKDLRFRYRVVIHPGDYETAHIAKLYAEYAK